MGSPRQDREHGSALIWAMLFVIVTSGMVISHSAFMAANRREMDVRYRQKTLATTFARSGLTDVLSWLQRQAVQPVAAFAPQRDPAGDPPLMDTLDPTLGLVREFTVRGNLWGRYEVRKSEVFDISAERDQATVGSVWDVGVRGYLYRLVDPDVPFDSAPNRVVAMTTVRSEVRGIPVLPPAPAAISLDSPNTVTVYPNASIRGGSNPAFAYPSTALPSADSDVSDPSNDAAGTPLNVGVLGYDARARRVFAMRLDQLQAFSNIVVKSRGAAATPLRLSELRRLGRFWVVFSDGDLEIPSDEGLRGHLLVVVHGDLEVVAGNDSLIRGVVYVTGDARIAGPFTLKGQLIVRGSLTIGEGVDVARIVYDGQIVRQLRRSLARYRGSRRHHPRLR